MRRFSFALVAGVLCAGFAASQVGKPTLSTIANQARAHASFGKLPLYFVENRGVYANEVCYYIQGADKTLFFTDQGVTIALKGKEVGWTVKLDFVSANKDVRPEGLDKQQAVFSYFKGPEKDWKAGLPSFSKIVYRDLWQGIDLVYNGTVNKLKYEFVVAPGADPKQIRLRYRGASAVTATDVGALRVETPEGSFEDAPPVAWQDIDGQRVPVEMAYAGDEDGTFTFDVGAYDTTKVLILDPAVVVYCGYIGGSGGELASGIAVDAAGNAYVTGTTVSTQATFPEKVGPDSTYNGGNDDAFVAKVNAQGTALVYCGYIGGSGGESASGIAVDAAGNAYVTGWTSSDQKSFPVKAGPDLTYNSGSDDAFVAKVNAQGTALVYCGYIGGDQSEGGYGVVVDGSGNAYVAGTTDSAEQSFPVKVGPDLTYNYGSDAFVAKVNANGTGLIYCGYIGGVWGDRSAGVAVDALGSAYVVGSTSSLSSSFPVKTGPFLASYPGLNSAFVAKVSPSGASLVYCGYISGGSWDSASAVSVDQSGNAYVTGWTASDEKTFPVKTGPDVTYNGGASDGFVARVNSTGTALDYCGYIGGAADDYAHGIGVDLAGCVHVCGDTDSDEKSFPVTSGPDLTYNGKGLSFFRGDGFVAKVNAAGTVLVYCGYIGGSGDDQSMGIAVDAAGNAYVTGHANSDEKSFPVSLGPDLTYNGGAWDSFVAKVGVLGNLTASGAPRLGLSISFSLAAIDAPGLPYQMGTSLGSGPLRIGTRSIGLSVDNLLQVAVGGLWPHVFQGYKGNLDSQGRATAKIVIPNIALLVGQRFHSAFVALDPSWPLGVRSISNTFTFTITK